MQISGYLDQIQINLIVINYQIVYPIEKCEFIFDSLSILKTIPYLCPSKNP